MSNRCSAEVFDRYPGGGGEFALALALADNAHDDGTHIFPSVATMAQKSRQSVRAVQYQLSRMLAVGWLLMVKPAHGRGRCAEYRINPEWLKGAEIAPFNERGWVVDKSAKGVQNDAQKGATGDIERVQNDAQKGATGDAPIRTRVTIIGTTPLPPLRGAAVDCEYFREVVDSYPPMRVDQARAAVAWARLDVDGQLAARIVQAVRVLVRSSEWQRDEGRFVPKLSKWLRNQGWLMVRAAAAPPAPSPAPALPMLSSHEMEARAAAAREAKERARQLLKQYRREPVVAGA